MKRILVPSDGSGQSVKALGIAQQIAQAQHAEILLARVVEPFPWMLYPDETLEGPVAPPVVYDELSRSLTEEAREGLARLASQLQSDAVAVRTLLREGPVEPALLEIETSEAVDLVVMATHGRSGLAHFALGSVTERVIREGRSPVLVVRRSTDRAAKLERALVALDGSGVAEEVLPLVQELAGRPLRSVLLFRVVRDPQNQRPALTYLEAVGAQLAQAGLQVETQVVTGRPRRSIQEAAQAVDLVVVCTHGRGGFDRLRHGRVAESLVHDLDGPILLKRVGSGTP